MLDTNLLNALSSLVGLRNHLAILNQGSIAKNPKLKQVPGLLQKMDSEIIDSSIRLFETPEVNLTGIGHTLSQEKRLKVTNPSDLKVEVSLDDALDNIEKKSHLSPVRRLGEPSIAKKVDGRTKRVSEKEVKVTIKPEKKTFEMSDSDFEKASLKILDEETSDGEV